MEKKKENEREKSVSKKAKYMVNVTIRKEKNNIVFIIHYYYSLGPLNMLKDDYFRK